MDMAVFRGLFHLVSVASLSVGLNRPYNRRNSLMISLGSSVVRYIRDLTPPSVTLVHAGGIKRFNPPITAAFTFSLEL